MSMKFSSEKLFLFLINPFFSWRRMSESSCCFNLVLIYCAELTKTCSWSTLKERCREAQTIGERSVQLTKAARNRSNIPNSPYPSWVGAVFSPERLILLSALVANVAQVSERPVYQPEGQQINSRPLQSACQSNLRLLNIQCVNIRKAHR